jgi:hypothetical protein
MLIYSMSVSVAGLIADRERAFEWTAASDELFRFHTALVSELGLVDELRMSRCPVVVGGGTPFLPPVTEGVPLARIETRTFGSRVVYERYRRIRDDSD